VVIGKIDDVRFSMWGVDINSPYSGILPASEVFGREKKELSRVFDIGDVLFLRIVDVDEVKKVKLGLKGRGMGKFKGGVIVDIAPTKVPRLIGKKGSMINMIKDKTGCKIVVGQNGLVWVKGNEDMEQIVKNVIKLIEKEAHTSGLTDRIKNKLCLLIDGELPPEENEIEESEQADEYEEDSFEEGLKKPELQDFREEVEKELAEELANEDSEDEDDFEDFDDDLDDDSDEDEEDLEDFNDDSEDEEGFEDFDDDLDDDSDEDEDFEDSEDEDDFEDFDDDLDDDSEDEDEDFEDSEDEEDESEEDADDDSEEEIEESEEDISDEQLEDVINDAISEDEDSSEDADLVEDEENDDLEASEEDADEDSEDKEEEAKEDSEEEKEEKSKKPKFLDTFEYINEQKKKNKSSFDFSRADNSKSPTLNISQGRGI